MTHSMTAYASRTGAEPSVSWVWEMRGVNARGLDVRLRLPDGFEALEPILRAAIKGHVHRGNITVSLRVSKGEDAAALALDEAQLDRVLQALDAVQERAFSMGVTLGQPTAADVLAHRGVVQHSKGDSDVAEQVAAVQADIAPLIADFVAMRAREGQALNDVPVKQDVTEELDRLGAHVAAARAMLADPAPMGRKLDFLAQEFNREANTLCSKAQNKALTAIGLDLKAVIDQMREQIQNVE